MFAKNQIILSIIEVYKILFNTTLYYGKYPKGFWKTSFQESLIDMEASQILKKGLISLIQAQENSF